MHHIIWVDSLAKRSAAQIRVLTCASAASQKFASGKREFTIFETLLRRNRVVPVVRGTCTSVNECNGRILRENYLASK